MWYSLTNPHKVDITEQRANLPSNYEGYPEVTSLSSLESDSY